MVSTSTLRSPFKASLSRMMAISLALILTSCNILVSPQPTTFPDPGSSQSSAPLQAEISFEVQVPALNTGGDQQVYIDILDEITGLALNPTRYLLQPIDETHFAANIPVMLGAVIKYRYTRGGSSSAIEYTTLGQQVRYRLLYADGPEKVQDVVSAWNDFPYTGEVGRITGQVKNQTDGNPVANILVTAGGASAITTPNGEFAMEGLPAGTHNLVAYALDGTFGVFQQGAVVQTGLNTPAAISISPSRLVKVTFNVSVPNEFVYAPVRLAGNLSTLGNAFADLQGGFSMVPARMPLLAPVSEKLYKLELNLPVGAFISYKYTLGDGFWNSEQTAQGTFKLRNLVVPDHDISIDDTVETWRTVNAQTVSIKVKVPAETLPSDTISIQFNPAFSWTEPLPMWKVGENEWLFILTSPMQFLSTVNYRFCLNDNCGSADDGQGYSFTVSSEPQSFEHEVKAWMSN